LGVLWAEFVKTVSSWSLGACPGDRSQTGRPTDRGRRPVSTLQAWAAGPRHTRVHPCVSAVSWRTCGRSRGDLCDELHHCRRASGQCETSNFKQRRACCLLETAGPARGQGRVLSSVNGMQTSKPFDQKNRVEKNRKYQVGVSPQKANVSYHSHHPHHY
jgi:hypothetical protein